VDVSAYYEQLCRSGITHGAWTQTAVPGTLDEMLDDVARRYSLPVPIADVVYSVPYEAFIGRDTKGGFVGRQTIAGIACAHLAYADNFVEVQVWIPSSGQPLPRRVELVYKQAPGAAEGSHRFHGWDPRRGLPTGRSPSSAARPPGSRLEQFVARLLAGGNPSLAAPSSSAPGAARVDEWTPLLEED
jgi:hypothetical protein